MFISNTNCSRKNRDNRAKIVFIFNAMSHPKALAEFNEQKMVKKAFYYGIRSAHFYVLYDHKEHIFVQIQFLTFSQEDTESSRTFLFTKFGLDLSEMQVIKNIF